MLARSAGDAGTAPPALPDLLGAVAAGHAAAAQGLLLRQAEVARAAGTAAREETERALHDSEARFYALFRDAVVGIGIGDLDGRILEVNEAFQQILGYSLEEFRGLSIHSLVHPDDDDSVRQDYQALVTGEIDAFRAEKAYRHRDGHEVWTDLTLSLVRDSTGTPQFQVAVVEDITDRRRLQEELLHQATHDSLTGLPNRALFLQRLEAALCGSDPQQRVSVLFLDLDGFKFVNDSRGHFAGDQVLTVAARRIAAAAARHGAFTARLAGDEFVVLVSDGESPLPAPGTELADDLLAALDPPIAVDGQQPVHVTASVGVVEVTAGDVDAEDVLRTADLALHAAKEDGRGQAVAHDPSRTARQASRFRIAADLPGAIDRGELALVYQPLVRLDTGLPHSMEALLRWNHPQLGQITPDRFVPVAEDSLVIVAMGRWVLERACQDLAAASWPAVNINVSVRQLYNPTLVDDVKRCLHENALAPHRLRIEVTESVIVDEDAAGPLGALRQLADLGVGIVMDDFGTGYSNLAALRLLPLNEIKLAGTFLSGLRRGLPPDPVDERILATLVDLAHALGLVVTAENIETREQDRQVRALGCDVGQGHYYGAPAPAVRRRPWLHVLE
jgi:diguanylate cyclase (GGDEF)-like protein/PAS domain S-box-containing protein